jgi:hypothetical protein
MKPSFFLLLRLFNDTKNMPKFFTVYTVICKAKQYFSSRGYVSEKSRTYVFRPLHYSI